MSSSRFKVRVTKDYLVFCSGHFITYNGDHCERLHGHNYRTAVEVEGDLDENHYVVDFIALKDLTRAITNELDHRMLLPTRSRQIQLHEEGANLRVTYRDRYWSFPREECALLPIANTTAELLADYIAGRLRQEMTTLGWPQPRVLRVEVEESFGQSAEVEWRRDDSIEAGRIDNLTDRRLLPSTTLIAKVVDCLLASGGTGGGVTGGGVTTGGGTGVTGGGATGGGTYGGGIGGC